jgi:hypothetical protein
VAVGHDLSRGVSEFTRVYQSTPPVVVTRDERGLPADESDNWLDTRSDGTSAAMESDAEHEPEAHRVLAGAAS